MPSLEQPDDFYGVAQRALQADFDTTNLADAHLATIVTAEISDEQREFIESRDFFFLSTVDPQGWPTVSYKGGGRGFVHVVDEQTISFPLYDGNGMFLSSGNIDASAKIGMLFIDFETPNRLRLHANARLNRSDEALARFPGANLVVDAEVDNVFVNCARYVHKHKRLETSEYVPDDEGNQPYPAWKRIDLIQPFLPQGDQGKAAAAGGEISIDEYVERLADGVS